MSIPKSQKQMEFSKGSILLNIFQNPFTFSCGYIRAIKITTTELTELLFSFVPSTVLHPEATCLISLGLNRALGRGGGGVLFV